jgi:hypothetical protein
MLSWFRNAYNKFSNHKNLEMQYGIAITAAEPFCLKFRKNVPYTVLFRCIFHLLRKKHNTSAQYIRAAPKPKYVAFASEYHDKGINFKIVLKA